MLTFPTYRGIIYSQAVAGRIDGINQSALVSVFDGVPCHRATATVVFAGTRVFLFGDLTMSCSCLDCGKNIGPKAVRCHSCAAKMRHRRGDYRNANDKRRGKKRPTQRRVQYCQDCGKKITATVSRCRSCAITDLWRDPEYREIQHEAQVCAQNNPEVNQRRSISLRQTYSDPQVRSKCSDASKAKWDRPGFREAVSKGVSNAWARGVYSFSNPSKLALRVAAGLIEKGFDCIMEFSVEGRPFDLYVPSENLLIEVDGEYWHYSEQAMQSKQSQLDQQKKAIAFRNGYRFDRIRERDVKRLGVDGALAKLGFKNGCYSSS